MSYNAQRHSAHERREDGRRSPEEVLSWVKGMRFHPEDLERAFFSSRFSRKLDSLGYVTLHRFRLYGEEALAGKDAALWLGEQTLSVGSRCQGTRSGPRAAPQRMAPRRVFRGRARRRGADGGM